jgi:hypothetical protein
MLMEIVWVIPPLEAVMVSVYVPGVVEVVADAYKFTVDDEADSGTLAGEIDTEGGVAAPDVEIVTESDTVPANPLMLAMVTGSDQEPF